MLVKIGQLEAHSGSLRAHASPFAGLPMGDGAPPSTDSGTQSHSVLGFLQNVASTSLSRSASQEWGNKPVGMQACYGSLLLFPLALTQARGHPSGRGRLGNVVWLAAQEKGIWGQYGLSVTYLDIWTCLFLSHRCPETAG